MDKPKLLIVDDDESLCTQLKWALAQDYEVFLATDRARALQVLRREHPAVVTLDLGLPPQAGDVQEGFRALADMLAWDGLLKVIIITGRTEQEHARQGVGQGAYDFLCKPIAMDEFRVILRRAFHVSQLEREHRELHQERGNTAPAGILGTSPQMQEVFAVMRKVAPTDLPVLISGESGTGKEVVARAIHQQSARHAGPFVAINCGAIPEHLVESELFGHEKGAFTGAHMQRQGRIEAAQGGTLLLDEIGELSLPLQVKLLRFLQDHRLERVGGRAALAIDTRVMAATNSDLCRAMSEGRFREDLYYRLAVVHLALPPLRQRAGDILLLARAFLPRYAAAHQKRTAGFTPQALQALETHSWPGNVRELENRIKRAVVMAQGRHITPVDLDLPTPDTRYAYRSLREARETLERELVQQALARHHGKITQAAAELGVSRPTLYELIEKLRIGTERV